MIQEPLASGETEATRVSCRDPNKKWRVGLGWEVYDNPNLGLCVRFNGGVTGYESFICKNVIATTPGKEWHICAGTPGRWDTLIIETREVDELIGILRQLIAQRKAVEK